MTTRHPRPCGRVISLDRGYPLVRVGDEELRAQHAIDLVKNADARAVVGDIVDLEFPPTQDIPLITRIHERAHTLVRRSLVESRSVGSGKHDEQILATNIDVVFVVTSLSGRRLDLDYLERQLVMAHESGAEVCVLLTKADQAAHRSEDEAASRACNPGGSVILTSKITGEGFAQLKELLQGSGDVLSGSGGALLGRSGALQGGDGMLPGRSGVLLGRSGVGKSTLINRLCGSELLQTAAVRDKDRAGRHTTVARKMIFLEGGATLIDTPGLRSIGLYDAQEGLQATFPEIAARAQDCRYRDCTHDTEPGCAVTAAVRAGSIPARRLASYRSIAAEVRE